VIDVTQTEDGILATVEGTYEYEVAVDFDNGKIDELWCECPYMEDVDNCKHLAAILYHIESHDLASKKLEKKADKKTEKLEAVIKDVSELQVKEFLLKLAKEDTKIKNMILTSFSKKVGKTELIALKSQVKGIEKRYGGQYGFIEYRQADHYSDELEQFMKDHVINLIENRYHRLAVELVIFIFEQISGLDIDDSKGTTGYLASTCCEYFQEILIVSDEDVKMIIFDWITVGSQGSIVDYMREILEDFLFNNFKEDIYLRKMLAVLDAQIANLQILIGDENSWSDSYHYTNAVMKRIDTMKGMGIEKSEIITYRKQFRYLPKVRQLEINECIEEENDELAIELLVESKERDKDSPGYVENYSKKLLELYKKLDLKESYKAELVEYVFRYSRDDLTYVRLLKTCCDDVEWTMYFEELITSKSPSLKYQLLNEDGQYQRLFDEITSNKFHRISWLDEYEDVLKKYFPEEMRDIYIEHIIMSAESTGDRRHYRMLIDYLMKILNYPIGKEKAEEILLNWKVKYNRRSSMMDELKKAGL